MPLYKAFGLYIHSEIDLPELIYVEDDGRRGDVNIRRGTIRFPPLRKTIIQRRGVTAQSTEDDEGSIAENRPYVLPAYPQLKIWETTTRGLGFDQLVFTPVAEGINKFAYRPDQDFPDAPVPLAKIFLLQKLPDSSADGRVSAIEAPVKLVRDFPLSAGLLRASLHQRHFRQSGWCAVHAEVWYKNRPEGFTALLAWASEELSKL